MGRSDKMRKRFAYGQAANRIGVHVPSERGLTMRPGKSQPAPGGPGNLSTKFAYLSGMLTIAPGKTEVLYLLPENYPYFQPLKAQIESNTQKLTIRAKEGSKTMSPNLKVGYQDVSHWGPGSKNGLGLDITIIVRNQDSKTAYVKVQLAGKPLLSI